MKNNLLIRIFFAILLAFTVNSFVYFGFVNSYSSSILNFGDFQEQFQSGIYRYRILSGHFLIWIYEFLGSLNIDYGIFKLKFLNSASEPQMFISFYVLNTFFLMLSAVVMVMITENKNFEATPSEKLLIISAAIFTVGLSQFVIVPYDVSSYFFLLLFIWLFLKYPEKQNTLQLLLPAVVLIFSTLNRESSALSLSLAATLLYSKWGLKKESIWPVSILAITFIAVYLGMRLINESFTTNDGSLLTENLSQPKNFLGMLFWAVFLVFSLLLANNAANRRNILIFHLISLPYIVFLHRDSL